MKPKTKIKNQTNITTRAILDFLLDPRRKSFAWRNNVLPVPLPGGGFRAGSKAGVADIIGVVSDEVLTSGRVSGRGVFLAVEVKTGRDRLRPAQTIFLKNITDLGGVSLVVKDFEDFKAQWEGLT